MSEDELRTADFSITHPCICVFAGDYGIASEGVSIASSEVTSQMVTNFAQGGAAICVLARQLGWRLNVVDCGILTAPHNNTVIDCRLGVSTNSFHHQVAMTQSATGERADECRSIGRRRIRAGMQLICLWRNGHR
ncbi:hypothetical protein N482_07620 [Pseudoalteromonas luteoviolacea NCIMB 1942]|uniref:Nicotinate-nucleotide--dimethylbenzimidazole phosphoribosyltransferase n=2 Tax=Pseudoalteromonas luteoviolacea TaxID=43657 RepID=A0A167D1W4_9GAMM|nr:hypothetical protein N482_07620 [Pseudoalteromonas luteoviolacea NCIMB 1942]